MLREVSVTETDSEVPMLQSIEQEFGSEVRHQRAVRLGAATREDLLQMKSLELDGVTPEMLRSVEKGDLFGSYKLNHLLQIVSALWDGPRCREIMGEKARQVFVRAQDARRADPATRRITNPLTWAERRLLSGRERSVDTARATRA